MISTKKPPGKNFSYSPINVKGNGTVVFVFIEAIRLGDWPASSAVDARTTS